MRSLPCLENWEQRYFLYALNRLKSPEAARDVTQESLISISKRPTRGSPTQPAYPKVELSHRREALRGLATQDRTRAREFLAVRRTNCQRSLFATASKTSSAVEQLLSKMDSSLATTLRLYYLEALTILEIAEVSDTCLAGTVKSRLFYARKMMTKLLENDHE